MNDIKIITFNSPKNILGSRKLNSQKDVYKRFEMTHCMAGNISEILCAGCYKVLMQKKPVNI